MCGLVALIAKANREKDDLLGIDKEKIFTQMLISDQLRGWDSTGAILTSETGPVKYYKRALPASDFIRTRAYNNLLSDVINTSVFIGHNRAATKGEVIDEYAHPFSFKNVIGVHNGTISGYNDLDKENNRVFQSDSEAIFSAINNLGYRKVIPEIEGAFALIWWDKKAKVVCVVRNDERPLSIITFKDTEAVIIASEHYMAQWIMNRNNQEVDEVFDIPPGVVYTFKPSDPKKYTNEEIKLKEKKQLQQHYGGYSQVNINGRKEGELIEAYVSDISRSHSSATINGYMIEPPYTDIVCYLNNGQHWKTINDIKEGDMITGHVSYSYKSKQDGRDIISIRLKDHFSEEEVFNNNEEDAEVKMIHFGGKDYTVKQWNEMTKHGCSVCSQDVTNPKDVYSISTDHVICKDCIDISGMLQ